MVSETVHSEADASIKTVQGTTEDAMATARAVAIDTHREVAPVRVFEQGNRTMLSGVLPIRVLVRILAYNAAEKGQTANKALNAINRPKDPQHVKQITGYLRRAIDKGEDYIIPPLTLNSKSNVEVYVPEGDSTPMTGYAVFPDEASVHITDGQHRYLAISEVVNQLRGTPAGDKFMRSGVPLMMTIESDLSQVHQDFADAGRTKPLPSSLLAIYDTRQPANQAVVEIGEQAKLLRGRIDATSKTLSGNSPFVFLVNQVRQFVKSSLSGSPSLSEPPFAAQADSAIGNPEARKRWVASRVIFLDVMTEIIPDWQELSELAQPGGADSAEVLARTKAIKDMKRVPMTAAFLNALGLVSHHLLKDVTSNPVDRDALRESMLSQLEPLREVEWERQAEIWNGNLVVEGKIKTQSPAIKTAGQKLLSLVKNKDELLWDIRESGIVGG